MKLSDKKESPLQDNEIIKTMTARKRAIKTRKVDLKNIDSKDAEEMISSYQQRIKEEVPLRINEKLTIFVTADKCNEKYRQQYIKTKML